MFKLTFTLIKTSVFAAIVLILGHEIQWSGKTLSKHIYGVYQSTLRKIEMKPPQGESLPEAAQDQLKEIIQKANSKKPSFFDKKTNESKSKERSH